MEAPADINHNNLAMWLPMQNYKRDSHLENLSTVYRWPGQLSARENNLSFVFCDLMQMEIWGREGGSMFFYMIGFFIWFNATLRNINLFLHLISSVPLAKRNALIYKLKQALR